MDDRIVCHHLASPPISCRSTVVDPARPRMLDSDEQQQAGIQNCIPSSHTATPPTLERGKGRDILVQVRVVAAPAAASAARKRRRFAGGGAAPSRGCRHPRVLGAVLMALLLLLHILLLRLLPILLLRLL